MFFSDESRFVLDNLKLIQDAFLFRGSGYTYYLKSLLILDVISPRDFRNITRKLETFSSVPEKVLYLTEGYILERLFHSSFAHRRIILTEIEMQCQQFFERGDTIFKSTLHSW